jgi:hypothetical protein
MYKYYFHFEEHKKAVSLTRHYALKAYGGLSVKLHAFSLLEHNAERKKVA